MIASVFLVMTLSGCATSGRFVEPSYPELPADLRVCFTDTVPAPKAGPMSKADVIKMIAALKLSETTKADCGTRLIAFYDNLAT